MNTLNLVSLRLHREGRGFESLTAHLLFAGASTRLHNRSLICSSAMTSPRIPLNRTYIGSSNLPTLREAGFESGSALYYREENSNLTDVKSACNFGSTRPIGLVQIG
jgi:hypothetical protein